MPFVHVFILILSCAAPCYPWRCSSSHPGPHFILPALSSGLHNQWLQLHSGLYAAMRWTRTTGGTVVLPSSAMVRKTFRSKLPAFIPIPIDSIFEVNFLCSHLNASRVLACVPDGAFLAGLRRAPAQAALPPYKTNMIPGPGQPMGWDPFNTILAVRAKTGSPPGAPLNASLVVQLQSNFGGVYVPHDVTDYYAWQLVYAREVALGIQFCSALRGLAITLLGRVPAGLELIAVHVRLENDWLQAQAMSLHVLLDQYAAQLARVVGGLLDRPYAFYLSAGAIKPATQGLVAKMLARFPAAVYTKASFLSAAELHSISEEQQAAVDAEVAVAVAHFVGYAYSSWSYVVAERRGFHGRPSLMVLRPGQPLWHPLFAPPTERWRSVKDPRKPPIHGKVQKGKRGLPPSTHRGGPPPVGLNRPPSPELEPSPQPHTDTQKLFAQLAAGSGLQLSEEVTLWWHRYQHMYGLLLLPLLLPPPSSPSPSRPLHVLQLGLGCDAAHQLHSNASFWPAALPAGGRLTVVDPDVACVAEARERGLGPTGGSARIDLASDSAAPLPGPFDVILDDGSLPPPGSGPLALGLPHLVGALLAPGGRYFAEAVPHRAVLPGALPLLAVLAAWAQRLALPPTSEVDLPAQLLLEECPLPDSVQWLLFQAEGCAVVRCPAAAKACQKAPARPALSAADAELPLDLVGLLVAPLLRAWPAAGPGRRLRLLAAEAAENGRPPAAGAEVWATGAGANDTGAASWLQGDPCDAAAVGRWLQRVGGPFDVIVDGGVADFPRRFLCLFDSLLLPGGLYLLEGDLGRSVGRGVGLAQVLASWAAQLGTPLDEAVGDAAAELLARRFPLPPAAKWLLLQRGAAALAKCEAPDGRACKPDPLD